MKTIPLYLSLKQYLKLIGKSTHYLSIVVTYDMPVNTQRKKKKTNIFFDLEEAYRFIESQGYEYHQIYEMLDYATVCVECGAFQHISLYFPTWREVQELNYCHKCGSKFDDSFVEKCIKQIHKNQKFYERGRTVGTTKP